MEHKNGEKGKTTGVHSPKKKNIQTHFRVIMTSIYHDYDFTSHNYKRPMDYQR